MMAGLWTSSGSGRRTSWIPLLPDQPIEIKNNIFLKGFETEYTPERYIA